MNLIIHNIGHYRVTDYGRDGKFQLFNRRDDQAYDITRLQYESIRDHMSLAACEFVEHQQLAKIGLPSFLKASV